MIADARNNGHHVTGTGKNTSKDNSNKFNGHRPEPTWWAGWLAGWFAAWLTWDAAWLGGWLGCQSWLVAGWLPPGWFMAGLLVGLGGWLAASGANTKLCTELGLDAF